MNRLLLMFCDIRDLRLLKQNILQLKLLINCLLYYTNAKFETPNKCFKNVAIFF